MTVISFINQKGGCGKSTLACHLAWWLANQGHSVMMVDSDGQQSASRWLAKIDLPISTIVMTEGTQLLEEIPQVAKSHQYVVVDGGGMLSDISLNILLRSDLAIVPAQPTGLDLSSTNDALKLAQQVQSVRNGKPTVRLVLSRGTKGTRLLQESRALLQSKGALLKTVIHQRQAIADCFGQGATVWTLPTDSGVKDAREEFDSLCKEIMEVIK
jgi:chromosome partitioning protein